MTTKLKQILDELKQQLAETYGDRLARVVLFGSQARGDARADSDIDVLVVLRGDVEPAREILNTGATVAEVSLRHDVSIMCLFRSVQAYEHQASPVLKNAHAEGIAV